MSEVAIVILEAAIKSILLLFVLLTAFAYTTFAERKVVSWLQVRHGPNRAGPFGILQPAADGVKAIFKEELVPDGADKALFVAAPILTVIPALIIMAVVPYGPDVLIGPRLIRQAITDINVGLLYMLSVASIAVYGVVLAGWSSNSKYSMMGGLRSTAQMISYEIALGISMVGPVLLAGSLSLKDIVVAQQNSTWYWITQPIGCIVFFIAMLAEVNRAPFDMPEAEQELTAGYHTEYSGMKFSLFFMAEYIKMIAVSAMWITLFFGGYLGPFVQEIPVLGIVYFSLKVALVLFLMIWIRATMPRMRYDQLMSFGWKVMLPLALVQVLIVAAIVVFTAPA